MIKNISFLFLLFFTVSTQTHSQHIVTPGVGFENITLGMDIETLVDILGEPEEKISRARAKHVWERVGYDVSKQLTFNLEFDNVYKFEANQYAIWKAFVNDGKVVYYNLSSYVFDTSITNDITIAETLSFYDNLDKVISVLGENYFSKIDENDNREFIYFEKGIRVIVNEDQLRNVYIFKPIKGEEKQNILAKLKQ